MLTMATTKAPPSGCWLNTSRPAIHQCSLGSHGRDGASLLPPKWEDRAHPSLLELRGPVPRWAFTSQQIRQSWAFASLTSVPGRLCLVIQPQPNCHLPRGASQPKRAPLSLHNLVLVIHMVQYFLIYLLVCCLPLRRQLQESRDLVCLFTAMFLGLKMRPDRVEAQKALVKWTKETETPLTKQNKILQWGGLKNPSVIFDIYYVVIYKKATWNSKDVLIFHIQSNALFLFRKTWIDLKLSKSPWFDQYGIFFFNSESEM